MTHVHIEDFFCFRLKGRPLCLQKSDGAPEGPRRATGKNQTSRNHRPESPDGALQKHSVTQRKTAPGMQSFS